MVIDAYMVQEIEIVPPEALGRPRAISHAAEFVGEDSPTEPSRTNSGHVKRERSQATVTEFVGEDLSLTAIVSSISPEERYNAVAMVCAIASPSLIFHRKLRKHKF